MCDSLDDPININYCKSQVTNQKEQQDIDKINENTVTIESESKAAEDEKQ